MNDIERTQLIDHIISGAPDTYFVYAPSRSFGSYTSYEQAKAMFDVITEAGHSYILLATRIGTGVAIESKDIE